MQGNRIAGLRRKVEVGQRDLAKKLGIAPQRLSDIERGYLPVPDGMERSVRSALRSILRERLAKVGGR